MTKEISPQEMLRKLVEKALEGGYLKFRNPKFVHGKASDYSDMTLWFVSECGEFGSEHFGIVFEQFILNADAMKAVFNARKPIIIGKNSSGENIIIGSNPALYYPLAAAKILLTTKDINKAIEYLYKEMNKC